MIESEFDLLARKDFVEFVNQASPGTAQNNQQAPKDLGGKPSPDESTTMKKKLRGSDHQNDQNLS